MYKKTGKLLLATLVGFLLAFSGYSLTSDCTAYAGETYNVYVPADTLEAGKNYIITNNADPGAARALSSSDLDKAAADVTVADDGNIYGADPSIVFTMGDGESVNYIGNEGGYVVTTPDDEYATFVENPPTDTEWEYDGTNHYLTYQLGGSTYYLYYKANSQGQTKYDRYRIKAQNSGKSEYTVYLFEEVPYVKYKVSFDVVNGQWNDGTDVTKEIDVSGPADEDLYVSDGDIPEVGENPTTHYGEGVWAPAIDTPITDENKSFTYSYSWLNHNYTEPKYTWDGYTGVDAERHCQFEGCSAKDEEQGHIESAVTKDPSCTEPGNTTYTATFTNQGFETQTKVDETNPVATGHGMTHHDAVAPTCTEDGNVEYYACSNCNKNFKDEAGTEELTDIVVPALDHDLLETIITPATTTKEGLKHVACKRCTYEEDIVIPMIAKKANTLTAKGKTVKVKKNKLRKKTQNIKRTKAMTVSGAVGAVTYTKVSVGSKKINKKYGKKFKVNKTTGKVTVKKGKLKKGTYKVKINVTAAGNDEYSPATKTVTVKIKVR